jgi:NitT/TauT family transport system substrate-binding protein
MPKAKAAAYKSPKDLKGMKIGVTAPGSSTNMFVNILLAKDGFPPDSVSIIGVGATAGAVAIMQRGEIDAIANLDPVIAQLEATGSFVPVIDTRTAKGMQEVYGGAYAAGCIYVPSEFSRKYPNTAQAIVNAMMRALRFIQSSTPDQIVAAVPADYYTDRAFYKASLERNLETYKHDGSISAEAQRNVMNDLLSFDPTMKGAKIDTVRTVNMAFQQKAAQRFK